MIVFNSTVADFLDPSQLKNQAKTSFDRKHQPRAKPGYGVLLVSIKNPVLNERVMWKYFDANVTDHLRFLNSRLRCVQE